MGVNNCQLTPVSTSFIRARQLSAFLYIDRLFPHHPPSQSHTSFGRHLTRALASEKAMLISGHHGISGYTKNAGAVLSGNIYHLFSNPSF
jgi:hypothetical protein